MGRVSRFLAAACGLALTPPLAAQPAPAWTVRPEWVRADEAFLAGDALRGRGSATRDEAIAAAFVASQFQSFGLVPAPGMTGYLQRATIVRLRLSGAPRLTLAGAALPSPTLIGAGGRSGIRGRLAVFTGHDPAKLPTAEVIVVTDASLDPMALVRARPKGAKLVLLPESEASRALATAIRAPNLPSYLEEKPDLHDRAVAMLPANAIAQLAARAGAEVALDYDVTEDKSVTTNAIGYLPGTDPAAGTLLLSAHLDHLGVRPDGTIMHGANDDAAGTTAVIELARALAAGPRPKRGILFVCYGSEELGGFGSTYFGMHPPVPLASLVANIEFEMVGKQDPKFAKGALMVTGYERSDLGAWLKANGALVAPDIYPEQHFFERSDNYALALQGVVAHTLAGWSVPPSYHTPDDTIANLDFDYMTGAIQSLVTPIGKLAAGEFRPQWKAGGRPKE